MKDAIEGAVRFVVPAAQADAVEENLFEWFGGMALSATRGADGELSIWVSLVEAAEAEAIFVRHAALGHLTFEEISREPEPPRDWVAEAAALRRSVAVGPYLLDPHAGRGETPPSSGQIRLWLPAARAFGTGSHESTRLAIRLLLREELRGRRVLDVGCGAGTLAFVAALEGAAAVVAFDLDPDAAFATREHGHANRIPRLSVYAGPLGALRESALFDVVVANMVLGEMAPLLPRLRARLPAGGRLLSSGLLVEQRREWVELLGGNGFRLVFTVTENEWLGTAAESFE
jgi:ribosomal protein L11 methyltransferase